MMSPKRIVVLSMTPDDKDRFPVLVDGYSLQLDLPDIKRYVAKGAVLLSA